MTDKQKAAFERSDARRKAAGLPPVRPSEPVSVSSSPNSVAVPVPKAAGCGGCRAAKAERSLANKLTTAILKDPEVTPEVLAKRQAICAACPHAKKFLKKITNLSQCGLCNCIIKWKTRLATEACPDGRWAAVDTGAIVEPIDATISNGGA